VSIRTTNLIPPLSLEADGDAEELNLTTATVGGLMDAMPSNDITVSLSLPSRPSVEIKIIERPGVSLGSTVFHGATLLSSHLFKCVPLETLRGKRVLELGAGTGLCGLTAAMMGADVTITDMGVLVPVLQANVEANEKAVIEAGGSICAKEFLWGTDPASLGTPFDFLIASDVVYPHLEGESHMELLLQSMKDVSFVSTKVIMQHQGRSHSDRGSCERHFFDRCRQCFNVSILSATKEYLDEVLHAESHPLTGVATEYRNLGPCILAEDKSTSYVTILRSGGAHSTPYVGDAVHESAASHCIFEFTLL